MKRSFQYQDQQRIHTIATQIHSYDEQQNTVLNRTGCMYLYVWRNSSWALQVAVDERC